MRAAKRRIKKRWNIVSGDKKREDEKSIIPRGEADRERDRIEIVLGFCLLKSLITFLQLQLQLHAIP